MQPLCEAHPQLLGLSQGLRLVLHPPRVLPDPVLQGDSDADASGVSIYGSVLRDGGRFRLWYQAWPRNWDGSDVVTVACAESDDGLTWKKPAYGLLECGGTRQTPLTDLPFHCPSVLIDPEAEPAARYRAFGYTAPQKLDNRFSHRVEQSGYYAAHSADGLHWHLDSAAPLWPHGDVITSVWDPWSGCARLALKYSGHVAGLHRRRFYTATWKQGQLSEPVSAFIPDEFDDLHARSRGFCSADYYGVALMPTPGPTLGILWNFRHLPPLGYHAPQMLHYGWIGSVDLSIICQPERGGRWLHLPGRPDWLAAADAPPWARGALYTASSPIEVGDETWLYFTGTLDQHGRCGYGADEEAWRRGQVERGGFARIGLLRWPRHRLIGYRAYLPERLQLAPRRAVDGPGRLILNAITQPGGQIRAALLDPSMKPLPGYALDDCDPVVGDYLEIEVHWRGKETFPTAANAFAAEIELCNATLYAFDFTVP